MMKNLTKKMTLTAAVMMTLVAGIAAEARLTNQSVSARLTKMEIQPNSSLSQYRINSGNVVLNFTTQEINLVLNRSFYCPQGKMCAQVMPSPLQFHVKNMEITVGHCQETIMTGLIDRLPVDGTRTEIQVVDNTTNKCMTYLPLPETEVTLKLTSPRNTEETHVFTGEKLN